MAFAPPMTPDSTQRPQDNPRIPPRPLKAQEASINAFSLGSLVLPLAPLHAALAVLVLLTLGAGRAERPRLLGRAALAIAFGLVIRALIPALDDELGDWLAVLAALGVLVPSSLRQCATRWHKARELLALALALATWHLLEYSAPLAPRLPDRLALPALERLDGTLRHASPPPGSPHPARPLLLVLWRSDCAPCLAQLARLAAEPIPATAAETLLVNQGESLLANLRALGAHRDGALRDPGQRLQAAAGTPGLPLTILLDRDGRVLEWHLGAFGSREWRRWRTRLPDGAMQ